MTVEELLQFARDVHADIYAELKQQHTQLQQLRGEVAELRRLNDEALAQRPQRLCANPTCDQRFQPRTLTHRFCSVTCKNRLNQREWRAAHPKEHER